MEPVNYIKKELYDMRGGDENVSDMHSLIWAGHGLPIPHVCGRRCWLLEDCMDEHKSN